MRKIAVIIFVLLSGSLYSHTFRFSWGSFNGLYFYPQTRLEYYSPSWKKVPMHTRIKLDMMGTYGIKLSDHFDLNIQLDYQLWNKFRLSFSGSAGLIWNSNFLTETNSVQPLVGVKLHKVWYPRHDLMIPIMLRFYGDGWDTEVSLDYHFLLTKKFFLSASLEYHLLSLYQLNAFESYMASYIGLGFRL